MKITELVSRFEFYAQNHKLIKHDPLNNKDKAFELFDMEGLMISNRTGLKFPALFLKTPEVQKGGDPDNVVEGYDTSFFIVLPVAKNDIPGKADVYDRCKSICDDIFSRILQDDFFDGLEVGTSEGEIGPVADNCFGWGITFTVQIGFDAEVKEDVWEDLQ